jgi:pimeloyl-ACP methyl ester carboxylesterase
MATQDDGGARAGFLAIGGRRIETAWWGPEPASAPTIVLLHEGLGCVGLWRDVPARLAAATGLGVFAWSRLGYGRSDGTALPRPRDYLDREARDWLPRVLDAAGIGDCVLVGHSDGASIAAIHCGTVHDPRVRGAVLIAPHVNVEAMCVAGVAEAKTRFDTGDLRARLARWHADVDGAFRGWNDIWLDPAFAATFDLTAEAGGITVPLLSIQGDADPYGTAAHVEILAREARGPTETMILPGIGHAPQFEAADVTLGAIARFARACLGTGGQGGPGDARDRP